MSDISNPTSRVLDVINFLAAHPTESFTLAEIARHLGLSNGSAHRILTTMADARFLSRHPKHKTYSLGMALVAVGQAALDKHRGIDIARREMARIAVELNVQCIATTIIDDDRLLLAKEGTPQSHDSINRVGERLPFFPLLGLSHFAWSSEAEVQAAFARMPVALDEAMWRHVQAALPIIRRRGYSAGAMGDAMRAYQEFMALPIDHQRDENYWTRLYGLLGRLSRNEVQLLNLADAGTEGVCFLAAPVFSPTGAIVFELTLTGMPINLGVAELERYGERLRTAAAIVTSETRGRMPQVPAHDTTGRPTALRRQSSQRKVKEQTA